jgi:hypothetical protein
LKRYVAIYLLLETGVVFYLAWLQNIKFQPYLTREMKIGIKKSPCQLQVLHRFYVSFLGK